MTASSSRTSMPTGHQAMQRPQPTQPLDPNWSHQRRELVGQPLAIAILPCGRNLPPATLANRRVKHESQVRSAVEVVPSRSDRWMTLVQKQVGQTSVQLVQARQRSATAAQPGCSGGGLQTLVHVRHVERRAHRRARAGDHARPRRRARTHRRAGRSSESMSAAPAGEPTRTTKPSSSSVSARSKSSLTSGPVPIEVQKQVEVGVAHSTATTNVAARAGAIVAVDRRPVEQDVILDAERGELAGAHADERERVSGADSVPVNRTPDAVRLADPDRAHAAGRSSASATSGRRRDRTAWRRRAGSRGSGPDPPRRRARPAGRRRSRSRRGRSPRHGRPARRSSGRRRGARRGVDRDRRTGASGSDAWDGCPDGGITTGPGPFGRTGRAAGCGSRSGAGTRRRARASRTAAASCRVRVDGVPEGRVPRR